MFKSMFLSLVLAITVLSCSGCATILGGIIGHQSGELCAGLAIGAAVDFGGDIVRGIGQMTADKEDLRRDFKEKSTFDAPKGQITLPICSFNLERTMNITGRLQKKFEENGWAYQRIQKTTRDNLFGPKRWEEKWNCSTAKQQPFEFHIDFCSSRDTKFCIKSIGACLAKTPSGSEGDSKTTPMKLTSEQIADITSQIYQWIEQIVRSDL